MQNHYRKMMPNKLFDGISEDDFFSMLACLGTFEKEYHKNEYIVREGEGIHFVGAVLLGKVKIIKTDYQGNELIIAEIAEGELFAEVFACAEISQSPVSIVAAKESVIVFLDYRKIISTCSSSCLFHRQLIANMLQIVANKTLYLNQRMDVISKRVLRDKILTYFDYESKGRKSFSIDMNREELAAFLCADRSALSNELSKMKKAGLIDYHKNEFTLFR